MSQQAYNEIKFLFLLKNLGTKISYARLRELMHLFLIH